MWPLVPWAGMQSDRMQNFGVQGKDMDCRERVLLLGTLQGAEPCPDPTQGRCPDPLARPGAPAMGPAACPRNGGAEPNFGSNHQP